MSPAPHILQILPALHSGGVERGTIEVASYLDKQGVKSCVVSSGGPLCAELSAINTPHYQMRVDSKNPFVIIANAFRLTRLTNQKNITLLHVRSRAPAWSALLASRLSAVPYIATFHGRYGHKYKLKRLYNSAMLRGKAVIAVSDFIAGHIRDTYPEHLRSTQLHVINRGVDCDYFSTDALTQPTKGLHKTHHANEQTALSLSLLLPGRLTRLKGHAFVLSAIERITTIKIKLTMVGADSGKDHYLNALKEAAAKSRHQVQLITQHQDLRTLYAQHDAVISASTKPESFGRTVIEAQAMGCLVIAPSQGANNQIICPALRCGIFTPNDEQSFAQVIEHIAQLEHTDITHKTQAARSFVLDNFQLQQMTQKTLELYQQLWQDACLHNKH